MATQFTASDTSKPRVSRSNPLPTRDRTYEDVNTLQLISVRDMDNLLEVLERIQQQLAAINNGNNLATGERFF